MSVSSCCPGALASAFRKTRTRVKVLAFAHCPNAHSENRNQSLYELGTNPRRQGFYEQAMVASCRPRSTSSNQSIYVSSTEENARGFRTMEENAFRQHTQKVTMTCTELRAITSRANIALLSGHPSQGTTCWSKFSMRTRNIVLSLTKLPYCLRSIPLSCLMTSGLTRPC
jgi:hypothetical protein